MRPNQKFNRILRYTTVALGLVTLALVISAIQNTESLTGRLVPLEQRKENREIPTMNYGSERVLEGFTAPADSNVIFSIPENVRISRNIFFGPENDLIRYWGYCFKGDERFRKENGYSGMQIYHENRFFYSLAEQRAQGGKPKPGNTDLLGVLESLRSAAPKEPDSFYNVFQGGDTCYVMTSKQLPTGLDADSDLLNAVLERVSGTDPRNPDTDGDGIKDGDEIYTTKTNPLLRDTDLDGLTDLCEDKDQDGYLDAQETSPTNQDTDRDKLCDGQGCVKDTTAVRTFVKGEAVWNIVHSSPVWSELGPKAMDVVGCPAASLYITHPNNPTTHAHSTTGEKMDDWYYQWLKFVGKATGTPKPALPIPDLPGKDL